MFKRVLALLSLVLFSASLWAQSQGNASSPDFSQEAVVLERWNESMRFENDGSGLRETTTVMRIQSQAGVQAFGQLVFGYSTANEDLNIEKTGALDRARHMYALAAAAGGPESQKSRQRVIVLNAANGGKDLSQAIAELEKMRTITLPQLVSGNATARFVLVFDNSTTPDRAQFLDGDEALRGAGEKLHGLVPQLEL